MDRQTALRRLPSVDSLLQAPELRGPLERGDLPRAAVVEAVRQVLDERRRAILTGEEGSTRPAKLAERALTVVSRRLAPRVRAVVNATGVVLHTNLGRAPLAPEAVEAMAGAAGYCNVEYDLAAGRRGHRHDLVAGLLRELTGAEAALVVNNNAAAVLLVLAALARGREVVVSRGELVEIGGSFRIPEVMTQSGAVLREVGTTNKTRLEDYERAIGPDTAALLKVHTSNYRVLGFTAAVPVAELVALGRPRGVAVVEDLGSGSLLPLSRFGLEPEPTVQEAVAAGADVVTFSGDKLLGGPQSGILVGRARAVEACGRHPLMRALRPDKVTLAALEATLALYRDLDRAPARVPAVAMLAEDEASLEGRAHRLAEIAREALGGAARVEVRADSSQAGGGSLPLQSLPTRVVEVRPRGGGASVAEARLRQYCPPVVARIREDALVFDPRTLRPGEESVVVAALAWALAGDRGEKPNGGRGTPSRP